MKRLREQWPWNDGFLKLMLIVPSLIGIAAAVVTYPSGGVHALWFLAGIPIAVLLRLMYGAVGKRIRQLKSEYRDDPGEVVEGLLVIGKIQSPGLAILRDNELMLVPMAGKACTIPLSELKLFREGRMLPGKYVWGKRAFIFMPYLQKRIAFAIEETIGKRWSRLFSGAGSRRV